MRNITLTALCLVLAIGALLWPASAQEPAAADNAKPPASEEEKTFYALGAALGQSLSVFTLTEPELKIVMRGVTDTALKRKPAVEVRTYMPKIQALAKARRAAGLELEKVAAAELCKNEGTKEGAVTTASGLVYTELKAGEGASPKPTDVVKVHYHGTLRDGTVFDSSVDRNEPATFPLNRVIPAWTEGLQLMKVGGKARLVCPASIAYGDDGRPGIPPGAALIFEVELLAINPDK